MPFAPEHLADADALLRACRTRAWRLVTAESCTGGLVAACLTEHPGASDVVDRAFVVYADAAKVAMLGVRPATLEAHGAVSELCAREMAEGALRAGGAGLALAITGIAGPGGGSAAKPVGLVHIACAAHGEPTRHERHLFAGDRRAVRLASLAAALRLGLDCASAPAVA